MQTLWCMYVLVLSCKIRPDVPPIFLYTTLWSVTSLPLLSRFYFHSPWSWASFDNWSDTVQFPGKVSRVLAASAFALGRRHLHSDRKRDLASLKMKHFLRDRLSYLSWPSGAYPQRSPQVNAATWVIQAKLAKEAIVNPQKCKSNQSLLFEAHKLCLFVWFCLFRGWGEFLEAAMSHWDHDHGHTILSAVNQKTPWDMAKIYSTSFMSSYHGQQTDQYYGKHKHFQGCKHI